MKIKIKPMSLGRAWSQTKSGRRFLVPEAKQYKLIIGAAARNHFEHLRNHLGPMGFTLYVHGPWLTKKGEISKVAGDLDNFNKLILDSLCEELGFDDCQIVDIKMKKILSEEWLIDLDLFPVSLIGNSF